MESLYSTIMYKEISADACIMKEGNLKVLQEEYWPLMIFVKSKGNPLILGRLAPHSLPEPDAEIKISEEEMIGIQVLTIGEGYDRALNREFLAKNKSALSSGSYYREAGEVKVGPGSGMMSIDVKGDVDVWIESINKKLKKNRYHNTDILLVNIRIEAHGFIDEYKDEILERKDEIKFNNSIKKLYIIEGCELWIEL